MSKKNQKEKNSTQGAPSSPSPATTAPAPIPPAIAEDAQPNPPVKTLAQEAGENIHSTDERIVEPLKKLYNQLDAVILCKGDDLVREVTTLLDVERDFALSVIEAITSDRNPFTERKQLKNDLLVLTEVREGTTMDIKSKGLLPLVIGRFNSQYIKHIPLSVGELPILFNQGAFVFSRALFDTAPKAAATWMSPINFNACVTIDRAWQMGKIELAGSFFPGYEFDPDKHKYQFSVLGFDPNMSQ